MAMVEGAQVWTAAQHHRPHDGAHAAAVATVVAKRMVDVVVAVTLLVLLAPVLVAVALAVGLTSPGPVLFRQRRVGRGGVGFDLVKFRSMRPDAERHLSTAPELHAAYLAGGYKLAPGSDPRITAVGRLLRRMDFDELPQLWNVVKGDMSLVGPRPVPEPELDHYYGPHRRSYEAVRPGMTGLWQVSGRNRLDHARRVALDVDYVGRLNLGRDLAILARTLPAMVRGGGVAPSSGAGVLPTAREASAPRNRGRAARPRGRSWRQLRGGPHPAAASVIPTIGSAEHAPLLAMPECGSRLETPRHGVSPPDDAPSSHS